MDRLLTIEEVSEMLGLTRGALAQMRYEGRGPKYAKLSAKAIRYRASDVSDWVDGVVRASTADAA